MVQRTQLFYNESIKSLTYKGEAAGRVYLRKAVNMLLGAIKYGEERWMYRGGYFKCKQY